MIQTMSLGSLRQFLQEQFEISPRTLSWYLSEDLIPQPEYEGREGYYDLDKIDIVNFVGALRMMNQEFSIPLRAASRLLTKHRQNLQRLVALLGGLATEYPLHPFPVTPDATAKNLKHRAIRRRFFQALQTVTNVKDLSIVAIEEELQREWAAQPPVIKTNLVKPDKR